MSQYLDILPENCLPTSYKENGYDFIIIKRVDDIVIAEQRYEGRLLAYEVYKVKKTPPMDLNGYSYPAKESTPGSSQWGISGWTFFSLEDAEKKLQELLHKTTKEKNGSIVNNN